MYYLGKILERFRKTMTHEMQNHTPYVTWFISGCDFTTLIFMYTYMDYSELTVYNLLTI